MKMRYPFVLVASDTEVLHASLLVNAYYCSVVLLRLKGSQQLTWSGSVTGSALDGGWMVNDDIRVFSAQC